MNIEGEKKIYFLGTTSVFFSELYFLICLHIQHLLAGSDCEYTLDASLWVRCNLSVHKLIFLPVWLCCQLVMLVAFEAFLHFLLMKFWTITFRARGRDRVCLNTLVQSLSGETNSRAGEPQPRLSRSVVAVCILKRR